MADPVRDASQTLLSRFFSRLKFPQLFGIAAALFLIDLVWFDPIPLVDEIMLGLLTLMLARLKKPASQPRQAAGDKPRIKDITPDES